MGDPQRSTCELWATPDALCGPCEGVDFEEPVIELALQTASDILFVLSGRQFPGECTTLVRPCGGYGIGADVLAPGHWSDRSWSGFCGCSAVNRCGCGHLSELKLTPGPVREISEVKVDGVVLEDSLYRLDEHRYLVRLPDPDGTSRGWPCCQRIELDDDQEDTFSVAFTYGTPPPPAGRMAAAVLACELALSCTPGQSGNCKLPARIQTITRQGETMAFLDPFLFLDKGKTGIFECDLFLATYNPAGLRRRSSVMSPDLRRRSRRIG